jgi:hypothetical protein
MVAVPKSDVLEQSPLYGKIAGTGGAQGTRSHANRIAGYPVEIYGCWAYLHKVPLVKREKKETA